MTLARIDDCLSVAGQPFASKPDYSIRHWTERGMQPPEVDVAAVIAARAERSFGGPRVGTRGHVILADARSAGLPKRNYFLVVTSPPYFGMRSYVPDQWIGYRFLGGPKAPEYVQPDQIGFGTAAHFTTELGRVWANVAEACKDRTKLGHPLRCPSEPPLQPPRHREVVPEGIRRGLDGRQDVARRRRACWHGRTLSGDRAERGSREPPDARHRRAGRQGERCTGRGREGARGGDRSGL